MEPILETERKIVDALSQVISPVAAERLLRRAVNVAGKEGQPLDPRSWVEVIEGPLQKELTGILPISGLIPSLKLLVRELSALSERPAAPRSPTLPTLDIPPDFDLVALSDPDSRRALVTELAKWEGVLAAVLESSYGRESRLGSYSESLSTILKMGHWLLERRGQYKVFYTVLGSAQLVIRPLKNGWIGLVTRSETNLGQLLYRLKRIESAD
ncbi:MAG: hypothetical protein SFU83_04415 [Meiothermus sp.]|nr:hypothetical protein [Meiothermus sp.]